MSASEKPDNCVIVRLHSLGLGNLFFQYAAARAISARTGAAVKFDITDMIGYQLAGEKASIKPDDLDQALAAFNLRYALASEQDIQRFRGRLYQRSRLQRWRERLEKRLSLVPKTVLAEPMIHKFYPEVMTTEAPVYLEGTFINPKYFSDIRDELSQELQCSAPLPASVQQIEQDIAQSHAVSIHVRRGDYATGLTKNIYPVYGDDYVQAAVAEIEKRQGPVKCYLFSDDIEWAEENILTDREVVSVSRHSPEPWVDLALMSRCNHNVIANSTFSWWGAYLNQHLEKSVVCPRVWRNDAIPVQDMILEDWIAV